MSTITKEQAKDLRNAFECWQQDYDPAEDKEQYDMFGLGMVAMDALLASLEVEESGRNPVLAYADSYRDMANQGVESIPVWSVITDLERNIAPLYTAHPEPVSVPDEKIKGDEFELDGPLSCYQAGKIDGWNECRAAMLQSFGNSEQLNSPVIPDELIRRIAFNLVYLASDEIVRGDQDALNALVRLGINEVRSELDSASDHLALKNGWVACSERMPDVICEESELYLCWGKYHKEADAGYIPAFLSHRYLEWQPLNDDCDPEKVIITHWMPMPEAPKQE